MAFYSYHSKDTMTSLRLIRFSRHSSALSAVACIVLLTACVTSNQTDASTAEEANQHLLDQPELSSGYKEKVGWKHDKFAVAAANPLATDAGYQILRAGGNAIDAAIAVQMVLTLVEPQSSGIGGGAFLLHHDSQQTIAYDGRETAPMAVTEDLFLGADGKPMAFIDGVVGGRSVGTPGTVRMLELAHDKHGKLPWARLFDQAIDLAENGFPVSQRLHTLVKADAHLKKDPIAAHYFYDSNGQAWPVGHLLKNPELAAVLRAIAQEKSKALHEGHVAQAIIDKVQGHPSNPGKLALSDLAAYQPKTRAAFCTDYTAVTQITYVICGMPPPSSGAIAIAQILSMTPAWSTSDSLDIDNRPNAKWLHQYTEASRLAFADRGLYVADPDFVQAPGGDWQFMVDSTYMANRAKLIGDKSMKSAKPGNPAPVNISYAPMPDQPEYGTSHISIIDSQGNAVAMTTTIETGFGSRQMVKGFLLNNELTDFSYASKSADGTPIANRVQPGKRPRSSMAPTLVFDKATGQLVTSAGSPGGALIIHYTAKALYAMLNWGMTPQEAINLPNFGSTNGPTLLEQKRFPTSTVDALKAQDHEVREIDMTSGLQAIVRSNGKLLGGADPRREGVVMGE